MGQLIKRNESFHQRLKSKKEKDLAIKNAAIEARKEKVMKVLEQAWKQLYQVNQVPSTFEEAQNLIPECDRYIKVRIRPLSTDMDQSQY